MAFETVGALLASKWGPLAVQGGLSGLAAIYGAISPNRARELQDEVIEGYRERRAVAQRQARGQFTPAERQDIRTAAQPQLQQVAGSVASRGLGSSPAGAAITSQAEQRVFTNAQQMAQAQQSIIDREAFDAASRMMQVDAGFFEDIQALASMYAQIRAHGGQVDPVIDQAVRGALGLEGGYTRGVDSRGDDI